MTLRRSMAVGGMGALLTAALAGCAPGYQELPSYRYRLEVEVATPEGVRRGASVVEVRTWQAGPETWPSPGAIRTRENAEAVAIDLGRRGIVFALLRAGNFLDWPGAVARSVVPPGRGDQYTYRRAEIDAIKALRGVKDVPRTFSSGSSRLQNWPDLVRFADRTRPETVSWIGPSGPQHEATGEIRIHRVTIEIVDAPITERIGRLLPWLRDATAERRLPTDIDRAGLDPFIPPLSAFDFTRSID